MKMTLMQKQTFNYDQPYLVNTGAFNKVRIGTVTDAIYWTDASLFPK